MSTTQVKGQDDGTQNSPSAVLVGSTVAEHGQSSKTRSGLQPAAKVGEDGTESECIKKLRKSKL